MVGRVHTLLNAELTQTLNNNECAPYGKVYIYMKTGCGDVMATGILIHVLKATLVRMDQSDVCRDQRHTECTIYRGTISKLLV